MTTNGNDIALVRLPRLAITVNQDSDNPVLPICMAWNSNIRLPRSPEYLVAGWGRTNNDPSDRGEIEHSGTFENILQKLEVPLVPVSQCKANYRIFRNISTRKHLCAGGETGKMKTIFCSVITRSQMGLCQAMIIFYHYGSYRKGFL